MVPFVFRCHQCDDLASVWHELAIKINIGDNIWRTLVSPKDNPRIVVAKADCSVEEELCMGKSLYN